MSEQQDGVEISDASLESARLTLRMAAALDEEIDFVEAFGVEFPAVAPAFKGLKFLQHRVGSARSDEQALAGLLERCIYVTSCLVVKCSRSFVFMDVRPFVECLEDAEALARKSKRREGDFAKLHSTLTELTRDLQLTEIDELDGKTEGILKSLVSW